MFLNMSQFTMSETDGRQSRRRRFSGCVYLSFEQTEMAIRAEWINEWLDQGGTVLGKLARDDQAPYALIAEALEPYVDTILCEMADGTRQRIYGYKHEPAGWPASREFRLWPSFVI